MRMDMVNEHGEEFANEFDKEFEIDDQEPIKRTLRHKLNSFANSLVRSRAVWYVSGVVDGAAILGILNHFFHFLR